jgi:hypothetical protein
MTFKSLSFEDFESLYKFLAVTERKVYRLYAEGTRICVVVDFPGLSAQENALVAVAGYGLRRDR